jgi:selenocysteine-specific elongation factor
VLAAPGRLISTTRVDAHFVYLAGYDKKLRNRNLVRFHTGTVETIARIVLLDREEMASGEEGFAQIVFETPLVAMAGDKFVLRSYSPVRTIGGGTIVDPLPKKHRRYSDRVKQDFSLLHDGTDLEKIMVIVERAGLEGIDIPGMTVRTGIRHAMLERNLEIMFSEKKAALVDVDPARVISFSAYHDFQQKILKAVKNFHDQYPLREGILKEELRTTVGTYIGQKRFNMAILELEKSGQIVIERENVRMKLHRVTLAGGLETLRNEIEAVYIRSGLTPPTTREVMEKFAGREKEVKNILNMMMNEGSLVRISEELYFHQDELQALRERYRTLLIQEGKVTPSGFKEMTGLTRKFVIPLMEYYDMSKLTVRVGEHRILRERAAT